LVRSQHKRAKSYTWLQEQQSAVSTVPPINLYLCSKCGFQLSCGWGGYRYVTDEQGRRIICPHPDERRTIGAVLGTDCSPEVVKERTGFNSYCLCLDCMARFEADFRDEVANPWRFYYGAQDPGTRRDERKCPRCGSANVKTVFELIGEPCPSCKEGIIEERETGLIS
jgi:hypothetical protein